jgi:ERF superfamily
MARPTAVDPAARVGNDASTEEIGAKLSQMLRDKHAKKPPPKPARRKGANAVVPMPAAEPIANGHPALAVLAVFLRDPRVPAERVSQAFDFFKRVEDAEALKAFNAAMASARAELSPIVKRHAVEYGDGAKRTAYKHETLGDIAEAVDPILARHGLAYRYRGTSNPNEPVSVTCIVSHRAGHAEETTLKAGADTTGSKNSIQAIGSATSYLQRYTLRLVLGLSTTNSDDDGRSAGDTVNVSAEQAAAIRKEMTAAKVVDARFCRRFSIAKVEDLPTSKYQEAIDALKAEATKVREAQS